MGEGRNDEDHFYIPSQWGWENLKQQKQNQVDGCKTLTMLRFCYSYYSQIILIRKEELNKDPASISHTLGFRTQRYSK